MMLPVRVRFNLESFYLLLLTSVYTQHTSIFIHASNHSNLTLIVFTYFEAVAGQVVNIPNQNELVDASGMC